MKSKKIVVISLLLSWAIVTAILLAGLTNIGKSGGANTLTGNVILGTTSNSTLTTATNTNSEDQDLILNAKEVAKHNSSVSCWMIIDNKVYDVTSYIGQHPGGEASIASGCGKDSTQAFSSIHSDYAKSLLSKYFIGNLGEKLNKITNQTNNLQALSSNSTVNQTNSLQYLTNNSISNQTSSLQIPSSNSTTNQNTNIQTNTVLSPQEIANHNSASSCWSYIYGKAYDLTNYISIHPGGPNQILGVCGKNGTASFEMGPHSQSDLAFLNPYFIGNLATTQINNQNTNTQTPNINNQSNTTQTNTSNQIIPRNVTANTTTQTNNSVTNHINTTVTQNTTLPKSTINQTVPSTNTTSPTQTNPPVHSITIQEISKHSHSYDCWSYVNTKVYDLTSYIGRYPGGPGLILNICGKNGTSLFANNNQSDLSFLNLYFIGNLATTNPTKISKDELEDSHEEDKEEDEEDDD